MDDFVLIHQDKEVLLQAIPHIRTYLHDQLHLILHPQKMYLQPYAKGVILLGTVIKPYRTYMKKRTLGFFYQKICSYNQQLALAEDATNTERIQEVLLVFFQVANSYLGFLSHYKSYKKRKYFLDQVVSPRVWEYFSRNEEYTKVIPSKK